MARRRGSGPPAKGGRGEKSTEYYIGTGSDLSFARASRQRVRQQNTRKWVIRIAVLAGLGFVVAMWGDDVVREIKARTRANAQKLQESGDYIKKARDERGGANFDENAPDRPPQAPQPEGVE